MPRSRYYGRPSRRMILGGMVMLSTFFLLMSLPQPEWDESRSRSQQTSGAVQDSTNSRTDTTSINDDIETAVLSTPVKNAIERISWYAHVAGARARKHIQQASISDVGLNKVSTPISNDRETEEEEQAQVNKAMAASNSREEENRARKDQLHTNSKAPKSTFSDQRESRVNKAGGTTSNSKSNGKGPAKGVQGKHQASGKEEHEEEGVCLARQGPSCESDVPLQPSKDLQQQDKKDGAAPAIEFEQVEAMEEADADEGLEELQDEERLVQAAADLEAALGEMEEGDEEALFEEGNGNGYSGSYDEDNLAPEDRSTRLGIGFHLFYFHSFRPMTVQSKALPDQINSVLDQVHSKQGARSRPLPAVALIGFIAVLVGGYFRGKQAKAKKEAAHAATAATAGNSDSATEASAAKEPVKAKLTPPAKTRPIRHITPETFEKNRKYFPPSKLAAAGSSASSAKSNIKVGVNKEFFRQIEAIFQILIPKKRSKETLILILHTTFLVLRTYLSVVVARLDGAIVRDLIAGNGKGFLRGLGYWFAIALPATYTNSMIRYLQSKLSIAFRTRMTRYVHDLYLNSENTYYKALNLDDRIQGVDQYITTDIAKFCDSLAGLYSNLGKPVLDTIIFNYQLVRQIGMSGMGGLMVSYVITAWLLRMVTPAFGKLAAIEAKLEGDFRSAHTRLITNAEEVAFYNGAELEHSILNKTYKRLIRHINSIYKIRIAYNMFEDFIIKYCWSAVGLSLCAIPVFFPHLSGKDSLRDAAAAAASGDKVVGARTKGFMTSKRLMMSLADAGGRMMYSYKEMSELAGSTLRVYNLISVLHQLHAGQYEAASANGAASGVPLVKTKVASTSSSPSSSSSSSASSTSSRDGDDEEEEHEVYSLADIRGKVEYGYEGIKFVGVPIVTPSPSNPRGGEELVRNLAVDIQPGDHMLVTGPNGVGKTGFARVVSGLWPVFRGQLSRPSPKDIFYIPQRAYLSIGTLRDQVIYPHSREQMIAAGRTDAELMEILKHVHLAYIPDREGGWDTIKEWKDVFSGGEKQRMNLARLFYHRPKYAILDECTSAVSSDVEGLMYNHAKDLGITLITISHRPALFKYHLHLLKFTGDHGHWEFSTIGTAEERLSLEKEMAALQARLDEVEALKKRHAEITKELEVGLTAAPQDGTKIQKRGLF
ncbi:hypothetical protein DFQ26_008066 [Actinomortierella ambigua]|nr:hypothetical protein DFQ26_008066 [Actinomortierella ambigua]